MSALRYLLVAAALLASALASAAELEQEVKAAFLFKFLSYVDWPEQAFAGENGPFVIGVLDAEEVRTALEEIVLDRYARGRRVEVRRIEDGDAPDGIHLLFVGRSSRAELRDLAGQTGVLVVGEVEGALDRGAMVNLLRMGDRVRFQVAPAAAERSGLHISSRILAVAQYVKPGDS